ncbi:MAG TPA: MarR family transcriptional regulator [Ktedonobacteraceae bacterium]|jgi:DNA-binding MarR family transcriptional regulator|nr:MarR family transcriptional regulator [Ktedonobacteraceae bacterium]
MDEISHLLQSDETYDENEREYAEMTSIAYALDKWYTRLGRQFGPLSRPQRRMLRLLKVDTPVRVGDLGVELGLTTAGTTRMLDKLEAMGYAKRSRTDLHDQRQVYVSLTLPGAVALRDAEGVFLERIQASLKNLSPTERAMFAQLLRALSENEQKSTYGLGSDVGHA